MGLTLFAAPLQEPVDVVEFARFLRVSETFAHEELALLEGLLASARQHLEGADGYLGRVFITQDWDLTLPAFPSGRTPIRLPLAPVQSVTSITYVDPAGTTPTWTNTLYTLDKASEPCWIWPNIGETYPSTKAVPNAVTVRFKAGYGLTGASVPHPIRLAIMALAAHWFENREAVLVGAAEPMPMPMHVDALLASYRLWPVDSP